jgi:DNA-binding NtrC family response regulator
MRILVVDDEDDIRYLLAMSLPRRDADDEVFTARDAAEALAIARAVQPDVVVTDLRLRQPEPPSYLDLVQAAAPTARVVVFSGWPLRSGDIPDGIGWVSKGGGLAALVEAVHLDA